MEVKAVDSEVSVNIEFRDTETGKRAIADVRVGFDHQHRPSLKLAGWLEQGEFEED